MACSFVFRHYFAAAAKKYNFGFYKQIVKDYI